MSSDGDAKPEWWTENEALKRSFDLPDYEPPRFADGVYTHEVVPSLEAEYGIEIQFIGIGTRYLDDWVVRIDRRTAFGIGRFRDDNGNTVYKLSADEFRDGVRSAVADSDA